MLPAYDSFGRRCLHALGSLWLGAVLLVLLLAALACATVFESTRGTEQALVAFYTSPWFAFLLGLFCINILAAVTLRFEIAPRKVGFLLTHLSVVLILIGAVVTKFVGVDGQLALVEGESSDRFRISEEVVTLRNTATGEAADLSLAKSTFGKLKPVDSPEAANIKLDGIDVGLLRFIPDSVSATQVINDGPRERLAFELILTDAGAQHRAWLFEGETMSLGSTRAGLTVVRDTEELAARLQAPTIHPRGESGTVNVDVAGRKLHIPLEKCRNAAVPIGDTPYSIRVLEFFPHATVGQGNKLTNASNDPVNPAIRAEITGPEGSWTTIAFANFPDFRSSHGQSAASDVKVTFVYTGSSAAAPAPIELIAVRGGPIHVRFNDATAESSSPETTTAMLELNQPTPTPDPGRTLTLLNRFDRAERRRILEMPDQIRETRSPAVHVAVREGENSLDLWLQKNQPQQLTINGVRHELAYADALMPMNFTVRLDDFKLGYYPGGRRPRSFESRITITDPATGVAQSRLISMNHPTSFGGFTFYQSSYQQLGDRELSVLSVSRDPGQAVVFTGYICLMIGMVWVLVVRVRDHRRAASAMSSAGTLRANGRAAIPLALAGSGCANGGVEPSTQTPSRTLPRVKREEKARNKQEVSS